MGLIHVLLAFLLIFSICPLSAQERYEPDPQEETTPDIMEAVSDLTSLELEVHPDAKTKMLTIQHHFMEHTALLVQFTDSTGRQLYPAETRVLDPNKKKVALTLSSWPEEPCILKVLAGKLKLDKWLN